MEAGNLKIEKMQSKFHKNLVYRIIEKTDKQGNTRYFVQAAQSFFNSIFGIWDEYTHENKTIVEAVEQIQTIDKYKLKSKKIVYKEVRK